jgi:hypothetical protein
MAETQRLIMAAPLGMPTASNTIPTFERQGLNRVIFSVSRIRFSSRLDLIIIGSSREGVFQQLHCAMTLRNSEATDLSALDCVVNTRSGFILDQSRVIIERT